MRVAVVTNFKASRKEPLGEVLERIHAAYVSAFAHDPSIQFSFADSPLAGASSAIDRLLKRFPEMQKFLFEGSPFPRMPAIRQVSNGPMSPAAGEQAGLPTLLEIARGVPRSLPIHSIHLHLGGPEFGEELPVLSPLPLRSPGITIGDSWWVSGRSRSLMALTVVEAQDAGAKSLPSYPPAVQQVLAACGKIQTTNQMPLVTPAASEHDPNKLSKVSSVQGEYRSRLAEIVEKAGLPHELPSEVEAREGTLGVTTGPKKPALVSAFKPLGYDCKGESGTFTLKRRTPGNLTVEISLDVGTWSNSLTGFYEVHGVGFTARLPMPPARAAMTARQYSIGDAERWKKITENLAALTAELDRTFVPEIEAAAGQTPAWYKP